MLTPIGENQAWERQVAQRGFRETAIAFLRDRLREEGDQGHVERLIRRLMKYVPQSEIVQALRRNPAWRERLDLLIAEAAHVTENPEVHFVFHAGGAVPNVPLLAKDTLYLGCGDHFYALGAETGELRWRRQHPGGTWTQACLSDDCLFVGAEGRLYALSPDTGKERWRFEVGKKFTSPYATQGKVFIGSEEGTLYALDARQGKRLWTFNVAEALAVAPGVWRGKLFAASRDHTLYAVSLDDGDCQWRFTTSGKIYAPPSVHYDLIYLTSADHKVYALNADRGQLLWRFTTNGEVHTSPVEKDGVVYVGSKDRHLYGLSAEDGRELWRYALFGYPSAPVAFSGMVYFSSQGRVYGFSAYDHQRRWCFPLGYSLATTPVAGQDRIYVGTLKGQLLCLKVRTSLEEQGARQVIRRFTGVIEEAEA
jgi:outer membrane protein assembly factor BamB